jgi:hypothetical protein
MMASDTTPTGATPLSTHSARVEIRGGDRGEFLSAIAALSLDRLDSTSSKVARKELTHNTDDAGNPGMLSSKQATCHSCLNCYLSIFPVGVTGKLLLINM